MKLRALGATLLAAASLQCIPPLRGAQPPPASVRLYVFDCGRLVKLARSGPVVLSGDLYHYPEERALMKVPTTEFNREQSAASRADVEAFVAQTRAQLWIEHDFIGNERLNKAPRYYD